MLKQDKLCCVPVCVLRAKLSGVPASIPNGRWKKKCTHISVTCLYIVRESYLDIFTSALSMYVLTFIFTDALFKTVILYFSMRTSLLNSKIFQIVLTGQKIKCRETFSHGILYIGCSLYSLVLLREIYWTDDDRCWSASPHLFVWCCEGLHTKKKRTWKNFYFFFSPSLENE